MDAMSRNEARETDNLLGTNASSNSGLLRRPYHYSQSYWESTGINSYESSEESTTGECTNNRTNLEDPWIMRANYCRYLYYNRLRRMAVPDNDDILLIPPHVIPSDFFIPLPTYTLSPDGKQSSLVTIFSLWNTMMGTSLLSMPWALEHAGIIPGILLLIGMSSLSFYTAFRILEVFEAYQSPTITDFAVLCKRLLGRWAQIVAVVFSALILLGATIVYWVLMSNFLYNTVEFMYSNYFEKTSSMDSNFTPVAYADSVYCPAEDNQTDSRADDSGSDEFHHFWDLYRTVPLFLIAILGPLSCVQSPTFFTKFNSLGTLSVFFLIIFVAIKGSEFGINLNISNPSSIHYSPLYTQNFPALAGMLQMAFFIHNCVLNIMKNNRHPESNKRDLFVAFIFVSLTYFLVGGTFYVVFPLQKFCIEDNFLNNFRSYDVWTFTARIVLFLQMVTVFPLLLYILRIQVCYAITKKEPTFPQVVFLSTIIIGVCVCFAIWIPRIGIIIRFAGAICGLVYIYILPTLLYFKWKGNLGILQKRSIVFHILLLSIGVVNLISQFIISD